MKPGPKLRGRFQDFQKTYGSRSEECYREPENVHVHRNKPSRALIRVDNNAYSTWSQAEMQPWKPELRASHPPPFSSFRSAFPSTSSFKFRLIGWGEINSQKSEVPGEAREVIDHPFARLGSESRLRIFTCWM